jgi:hypothetical protein
MRKPDHNKKMQTSLEPTTIRAYLKSPFRTYDIRMVVKNGDSLDYIDNDDSYHLNKNLDLSLIVQDAYAWSKKDIYTFGPRSASDWSKKWNELRLGMGEIRGKADAARKSQFEDGIHIGVEKGAAWGKEDPMAEIEMLVSRLYKVA